MYSVHFSTLPKRPNKPSAVWLDFDLYASQVEAHHQSISVHTVRLVVNLWAEDKEVIIICHLKGQALGKSPLRALFHSMHSLPVTCRTRYVINTLSCCCSVTILMAAHPGSLGLLLCLNNIRKKVALFFSISVCKLVKQHKHYFVCPVLSYSTKAFHFDCNNCDRVKCWLCRSPAKHKNHILDIIPSTDH